MIKVSEQRFNNKFRTAQDLNYLLSCIGETVTVETDFYYEDITYSTTDNPVTLKPSEYTVNLTDTTGVMYADNGIAFAEYNVGDTVGVFHAAAFNFYTVTEKFNDGMIRTSYGGAKMVLTADTSYVFNATPISAVKYAWNLDKDAQQYNSVIDGELQMAEIGTADCTNTGFQDMTFKGKKSYQIGSVELAGIAGSGGSLGNFEQQSFTIKHTFMITPLFLQEQYDDYVLGIAPDYFSEDSCLNYVAQIQVSGFLTNPNGFKIHDIPFEQSNVGWFGENFNGGSTNYYVNSVAILSDGVASNNFQFDKVNKITIHIKNTVDTPFSSGNTKYEIGFNYLPEDESYYDNTGKDQEANFLIDTIQGVVGSGEYNSALDGSVDQIFTGVTVSFVSSSEIKIEAFVDLGSTAEAVLKQGTNSRYSIWFITEKHSLPDVSSDKINLLCHTSEFTTDLTDTDLIDIEHQFIIHPQSASEAVVSDNLFMFIADDVAVETNFSIDFTGKTLDGILINKIKSRILLQHTTEADVVLESFTFDVSGFTLVDNYVQNIDFEQDRVFKVPEAVRKTISIQRNEALDSGFVKHWKMNFPFMNRWEYWSALQINNPSSGIFDSTKPLNGLNNLWNRMSNVAGWTMAVETTFEITQNGEKFEQTLTRPVLSYDFGSGTDWSASVIKTYDSTGVTELTGGGLKFVLGYEDAVIKASFTKSSGYVGTVDDVEIVIWIETFESGGILDIRRISSLYDVDNQSWLKSFDTSNKVVITKSGSTFTGTCTIDYKKLPANDQFTIYARIYDLAAGCADNNITDQDSFCLIDQDGNSIIEE